jgi:hypothetical protein
LYRETMPVKTVPLPTAPPLPDRVFVTPTLATEWLNLNTNNRTLRENRAAAFARDMLAGNWDSQVGDHINFVAEDGLLGNGQHRLRAVELAGAKATADGNDKFAGVWFYVTHIPRDTLRKVDLTTRRHVRDVLHFNGVKLNPLQATVATRAVRMAAGYPPVGSSRFMPTNEEVYDAIQDPQFAQRVLDAAHVGVQVRRTKLHRAGVAAIAFYACAQIDPTAADMFFVQQLAKNVGLMEDDPANALRKRLQNQRHMSDMELWNFTIHAWNHFRAGNRLARMLPPDTWGPNGFALPV